MSKIAKRSFEMRMISHAKLSFLSVVALMGFFAMGCQKSKDPMLFVKPETVPSHYKKVHDIRETATVNYGSALDILWVIDNSGSMGPHQQNVINNAALFMQSFSAASALDWKIGLISTDQFEAPYVGFTPNNELNSKTSSPVQLFQNAVQQLGLNGDTEEKTFSPILNAINSYPNFVRSDAYLAIIIVTDEEEQSPIMPADFLNKMVAMKGGNAKKILTYGVFGSNENCSSNGGFYYANSRYQDFMNISGGATFNLCAPDFGNMLAAIGANLISKVTYYAPTILLQARPQPNTIEVVYQGKVLPGGLKSTGGMWIYNPMDNAIVFHDTSFIANGINDVTVTFDVDKGDAPKPKVPTTN
jgi:hypothetical protein